MHTYIYLYMYMCIYIYTCIIFFKLLNKCIGEIHTETSIDVQKHFCIHDVLLLELRSWIFSCFIQCFLDYNYLLHCTLERQMSSGLPHHWAPDKSQF